MSTESNECNGRRPVPARGEKRGPRRPAGAGGAWLRLFPLLVIVTLGLGYAFPGRAQDAGTAVSGAPAQNAVPKAIPHTPAEVRLSTHARRAEQRAASLVATVPVRSIGPTVMSGRVVDIEASPTDPSHFLVAYASGGLWRTDNAGMSFSPLFDDQAVITIGDIAVDWAHGETIWVGTGENNSSRSSYAGTGVYRSADGGQTWRHLGLAETHHIGRIVLHPHDPNTAWVAALGHLYSSNPQRGVYKTTDGGQSWTKTLFVNDSTGAIDLVLDPSNPEVLFAALWHRSRKAWNFVEAGQGAGIYKSTDGGVSWALITTEGSGFPTEHLGRIGLSVATGHPNVLYALLDNQARRPEEDEPAEGLTRDALRTMDRATFLELSEALLEDFLQENGFPAAYTAQSILDMVRKGELEPVSLVEYLEDANAELFDTPVVGAEVYRSDDGGRSWRRTHEDYLDEVYYSYGYYFGEIRTAPDDPDRIYVLGVPLLRSSDGGRTFEAIDGPSVHVDHQALWVDPARPGHLVNGNDGGVNITFDDGATWFKANTPSVGQFYAVQVDDAEPFRVYGGLQDNGVWVGPSTYEAGYGWYAEGQYPYERLLGGDGMQIEVDTRTNDLVYAGFQFGYYFRIDQKSGKRTAIRPRHALGERPFRFNWQTPIHLSRHHQDILYLGADRVHRSLNQGEDWTVISGDLTKGGLPGDVPYGTLTSIDESPLRFGLIYAGSDDGLVHVTRDGGASWTRISDALPADLWVSRVEASAHAEGRIYVALNGYRWDHFGAYLYRSDDYGATWTDLSDALPEEPVNVVLEDPEQADVLYVGTDHGLYASIDGGAQFMPLGADLPAAPVHDLKIQARAKQLVIGTHGRSLFMADVQHVQKLTPTLLAQPLHLFDVDSLTYEEGWGNREAVWQEATVPEVVIPYYSREAGPVAIRIEMDDATVVRSWTETAHRGLNYAHYDLTADASAADALRALTPPRHDAVPVEAADDGNYYLVPGTYRLVVQRQQHAARGALHVAPTPEPERPVLPPRPKGP